MNGMLKAQRDDVEKSINTVRFSKSTLIRQIHDSELVNNELKTALERDFNENQMNSMDLHTALKSPVNFVFGLSLLTLDAQYLTGGEIASMQRTDTDFDFIQIPSDKELFFDTVAATPYSKPIIAIAFVIDKDAIRLGLRTGENLKISSMDSDHNFHKSINKLLLDIGLPQYQAAMAEVLVNRLMKKIKQ